MLLLLTKISIVLTAIFAFSMGVYTLYKNPKARVNQIWFVHNIIVTIWAASGYLIMVTSRDVHGVINVKLTFVGILTAIFFFHFVTIFLYQEKAHRLKIIIGYSISFLFVILLFASSLVLKDFSYLAGFGYYAVPGVLFNYLVIFFFLYVAYSFYLLIKAYGVSDGIKKKQIFYILAGMVFGYLGASTGFLINLFNVFPYGWILVPFYPILITYGIFLKKY